MWWVQVQNYIFHLFKKCRERIKGMSAAKTEREKGEAVRGKLAVGGTCLGVCERERDCANFLARMAKQAKSEALESGRTEQHLSRRHHKLAV